jgi:hypothetical protein
MLMLRVLLLLVRPAATLAGDNDFCQELEHEAHGRPFLVSEPLSLERLYRV